MYTKKTLPEKDDFVVCTIRDATPSSVFVLLSEYEKAEGMIHVSEIARKQVRAMKVYLKPGTRLVCKVMSVDSQKRFLELSLRRVGEGQRRTKLHEWDNEKIANDILEVFAKQAGLTPKAAYDGVGNKILDAYGLLYPTFLEISRLGTKVLEKIGVEAALTEQLTTLIQKRIVPPTAELNGYWIMQSSAPNGLEIIKTALAKASELAKLAKVKLAVKYISAPKYKFKLESANKKALDEASNNIQKELAKFLAANTGSFESQAE